MSKETHHHRSYFVVLAAIVAVGIAAWIYIARIHSTSDTAATVEPQTDSQTTDPAKLPPRSGAAAQPLLPERERSAATSPSRKVKPENDQTAELSNSTLMAILERQGSFDAAVVVEALNRWNRCDRYDSTSNPQYREEKLNSISDDFRRRETYLERWALQDIQCPDMSPDLRSSALAYLLEHAEDGNLDAQALYYDRGRLPMSRMVRNPAAAADFVRRMRAFLSPMLASVQPAHWDLLHQVYSDGFVYPFDRQLSATYRFASVYRSNPTPAELDQARLRWGHHLTDAEIDAAEQAGYQLYLACCGQ